MREFSYCDATGVDVLNVRAWSVPYEAPLYKVDAESLHPRWFSFASVQKQCIEQFIERFIVEEENPQGNLPLYLPWKESLGIRQQAMYHMKPRLETGISLINFLIELKDFKSWFDGSALRSIMRDLNALPTDRGFVSSLSSLAAEGILTGAFAVVPLISDIEKLCRILSQFWDKTSRFIEQAKALELRRHYRAVLTPGSTLLEDLSFQVDIGESNFVRLTAHLEPFPDGEAEPVHADQWLYHATMDYDYTVQELVEWDSQFSGFCQQLGVRLDPSIIWNAVPWTFVLDWFVRISDWLQANYTEDVMSSKLTVHNWSESSKMKIRYDISMGDSVPGANIYRFTDQLPFQGFFYASVYRRGPSVPPDLETYRSLDVDKGISSPRYAVSAALLRKVLSH
jgi:hypothetical protein